MARSLYLFIPISLFYLLSEVKCFVAESRRLSFRSPLSLQASTAENDENYPTSFLASRRGVISTVSAVGIASLFPLPSFASDGLGTSPDSPIVVLGAGGKVGKLCTEILAKQGRYVRAVTRSGREVLGSPSDYVTYASGDVTKYDTLEETLKGSSGVIFAASASGKKKGGDPAHVDYYGVYNTAKACLADSVSKLVVVSAGTVTRPDSLGFKATNFFVKYIYGDNIMGYKIAGEEVMRDLYAKSGKPELAYAVVRPGGLSDGPSVGSSKVHVSQGDVYSSEIAREDVALVTVAALLKGKSTDFTTFELNQEEGLGKAEGSLPDLSSELVHAGAPTFEGLLDGLLTDEQMKSKHPELMTGFRGGDSIEPIDKLA